MRNIESLNAELLEKEQYIEALKADNDRLAKIIHKDNKLIPAMEFAVEQYLQNSTAIDETAQTGNALLEELRQLSQERKGMIVQQDQKCEKLPSAGITRIDSLLLYMQQKAITAEISFHVTLDCNLQNFLEKNIGEESFCTLLADLIDNAIIATKYNNGRHVLLNIGTVSKYYAIHIFDSGIPFTKEVLVKLGQEQITTHADDSGSGIGLMQTHEILKKHGASLFIDEFTPDTGLYTKKVSVVFNKLNHYTLYTTRDEQEITYLNQRSDLTVVQK
ncbi:MAG: ATP-binding protein [Lachnospiraceae bacterium]